MEFNGLVNNTGLAAAFIVLLIFGFVFNSIVERFQKRTHHYTAEFVVVGVLVTVMVSGLFIGWSHAWIVLVLFIASGLPMILGSWIRATRDEEQAKKIQKETSR